MTRRSASSMLPPPPTDAPTDSDPSQQVKRNPLVASNCAEYLGAFVADEAMPSMSIGTQWLAWRFESDCTLAGARGAGRAGRARADPGWVWP